MAKSDYTTLLNLPGSVSFFAITAMRDLMLPNMLGEEQHHILYWAGRDLATKLPVAESALPQLFTQVGLGTLSPLKQKRQERQYLLAGDVVATRIRTYDDPDFQLEAGFLASAAAGIWLCSRRRQCHSAPRAKCCSDCCDGQ
jgi:hypothetical protein